MQNVGQLDCVSKQAKWEVSAQIKLPFEGYAPLKVLTAQSKVQNVLVIFSNIKFLFRIFDHVIEG